MSTTIVKRLEIDAGHRLLRHEGKCRHPHGHRYAFEIEVSAEQLDDLARVVDFGVIKELVGGWLDQNWDHGFILQPGDPLAGPLEREGAKLFYVDAPPTAETLAAYLHGVARSLLGPRGLRVDAVACLETPTSRATYRP